MSEYKSRANNSNSERLSTLLSRIGRNRLSAIDGKRKFRIPNDLHNHGGRTWSYQFNLTIAFYYYRVAIAYLSAAAFGAGVGQCYAELMRLN